MHVLQPLFMFVAVTVWFSIQAVQSDTKGQPSTRNNQRNIRFYRRHRRRHREKRIFDIILEANSMTRKDAEFSRKRRVRLFQGDIVITKELRRAIQKGNKDYIILADEERISRAAAAASRYKWPIIDGLVKVPYKIEPSSVPDQVEIQKAIRHWTDNVPCITFVPRTVEKDYISFFAGDGCFSWTGRTGGKQRISIGEKCAVLGVIAHEIGHALGFWHEQSRPDRDKYVEILWDNIRSEYEKEFEKVLNDTTDDLGVPYDYNSLMHYGPTAFSKREDLNTIVTIDGGTDFGNAQELSEKDIEQARLMYCPGTKKCSSLYRDNHKHCLRWAEIGYCSNDHKEYMRTNCRKSCVCAIH